MNLYFIADGLFDLLVVAKDINGAIAHWRDYYGKDTDDAPEQAFEVNADLGKEGPRSWHSEDCKHIWVNNET